MKEVPIDLLRQAIRDLHGCEATFLESVPVLETFEGKTVWEGVVQVFGLEGHRRASRCYAWSHETDSGGRKFVAVVNSDRTRIDGPEAAVRAAILEELR